MELPIEFQNKANALESKWANTPHKYEGIQQADGYEQGALDILNAVEAMLKTRHQQCMDALDLGTTKKSESHIRAMYGLAYIDQILSDLQSIKPL